MTSDKIPVFLIGGGLLQRECMGLIINQQPDMRVCGAAEDLATAFEAISNAQPDVIIIHLPARISLITELKTQHSTLAVIVIVSEGADEATIHVLRAGASGVVKARDTSASLLHAVRAATEGNVHVSESLVMLLTRHATMVHRANAGDKPRAKDLSEREFEIFALLAEGQTTSKIAQIMGISIKTVQAHCDRIKQKRGFRNRFELIQAATRWADKA